MWSLGWGIDTRDIGVEGCIVDLRYTTKKHHVELRAWCSMYDFQ